VDFAVRFNLYGSSFQQLAAIRSSPTSAAVPVLLATETTGVKYSFSIELEFTLILIEARG